MWKGFRAVASYSTVARQKIGLSDLPSPRMWPLLANLPEFLSASTHDKLHLVFNDLHDKLGPVYRVRMPKFMENPDLVCVADVELIEDVYRASQSPGSYPNRPTYLSWHLYRAHKNESDALLTSTGKEWAKYRRAIGKKVLRTNMAALYSEKLNVVVTDMISRLRTIRRTSSDGLSVPGITYELYKWSLEAICLLLYERRMGCLEDEVPEMTQLFINSIDQMWKSSQILESLPRLNKTVNSAAWKQHTQAWDYLFATARRLINERLTQLAGDENVEDNLLTHFIEKGNLNEHELCANMTELMLGAVDTTSNTLAFAIYNLADNQDKQDKLFAEVEEVLNGRQDIVHHDFKNMPYMKKVIKETLRMYSPITLNSRLLDKPFENEKYKFPAETLFLFTHWRTNHSEKYFKSPEKFMPERWEKINRRLQSHAFASLPFGFGTRSCVGRRIAEIELYLGLSRIVQNFKLIRDNSFDIQPKYRSLLIPGENIPVHFIDR